MLSFAASLPPQVAQQQTPADAALLCESLVQTLQIYEKCLSFDYTAILLNETLEDPTSTNVPSSWRPLIAEKPETVRNLFLVLKQEYQREGERIKKHACMCLAHLVNTRQSLFENQDQRIAFVTNIATEIINYLQTPSQPVLASPALYREFVPILIKMQSNF